MKKTRKRLPGLIRKAPTTQAAARLAMYGENPPSGPLADLIERVWIAVQGAKPKDKPVELGKLWQEWWPAPVKMWNIFARAIGTLDEKPFLEAAEVIRRVRERWDNGGSKDALRLFLLSVKQLSELPEKERRRLKLGPRYPSVEEMRKNSPGVFEKFLDDRHIRRVSAELGLKPRTNKRQRKA